MNPLRSLFAVLLFAATATHAAFSTFPATPVAGQEFVVRLTGSSCSGNVGPMTTAVEGNTLFLRFPPPPLTGCIGVGFAVEDRAVARVAQAGTYEVRLGTSLVGVLNVVAGSVASAPAFSLSGLWYVPSQPGWGLRITQEDSGQLFLVWYTYDRSATEGNNVGTARWYVASGGTWAAPGRFVAPFYFPAGPSLFSAVSPFDPAKVSLDPRGVITLTVKSADAITFSVEGSDGSPMSFTWELSKYDF